MQNTPAWLEISVTFDVMICSSGVEPVRRPLPSGAPKA